MPYTPNSTWVDGSGGGTPISAARLNNLESGVTMTYDAYTPTWTTTGTAPVLGNGVLAGRYMQRGKHVHAYGSITFGTTSTYGTGTFRFALPVTAAAMTILGSAYIFDGSTTNFGAPTPRMITTTTMEFIYGATYLGALATVGQLTPWTWASTDQIVWNITYEAA